MKKFIFSVVAVALFSIFYPGLADAGMYGEVYIPDHEFVGFYDETGTYTVVAGIKNKEYYAIEPTITISILDGDRKFEQTHTLAAIEPDKMLPLKLQFPEGKGSTPILNEPVITYEETVNLYLGGYVIYETLVIHDDGSITGEIRNGGEKIFENFRIYALIKDKDDNILDISSSEIFHAMKPGDVFDFKMLAPANISDKVDYYSCFAFGDDAILPVNLERNDENYTYRYTANAWFKDAQFSEDGSELEIYALNGYILPVTGSFEFPTNSINEKYEVVLDGERLAKGASAKDPKERFTETVDSLQSIDEMGNWHLYFEIPESFQGNVRISGFVDNDGTFTVPDEMDITNLLYYETVGGEINTITAFPNKASLVIDMDSSDDGQISLKINDFLVRPFDNDEYIVQIHYKPGLFNEEIETIYITDEFGFEKGLTITIPFKNGAEKIEIFGSYVVPEFGQMAALVLAGTIVGIVIISKKTNSFSNLFYTRM